MLRVGLTGGIGAGKSTVARRLAEHGAVVVDSDVLARAVVEPGTEGLDRVVAAFGSGVLAADGSLDRPALAKVVFGDAGALATLNGIVHPLVRARSAEIVARAAADAVVVHDVPLLVENGMAPAFHLVLVVHAPVGTRVERLVGRGLAADDARARITAQATDEQRRAAADVWLDNSGWPEESQAAADELWAERLVPFEANVRLRRAVDGPTAVVDARPEWAAQGRRLAARLSLAAGGRPVEHVGPTSRPGTPAPDVLEFEIAAGGDDLGEALEDAGFPRAASGGTHGSADPGRPAVVRLARD